MGETRRSHGRRWTRFMRLPAMLGLGLVLVGAGDPARTTATVSTDAQQTLRGWGMSLAWEANVIYGGPFDAAQVPDPADQGRTMDLLFREARHSRNPHYTTHRAILDEIAVVTGQPCAACNLATTLTRLEVEDTEPRAAARRQTEEKRRLASENLLLLHWARVAEKSCSPRPTRRRNRAVERPLYGPCWSTLGPQASK